MSERRAQLYAFLLILGIVCVVLAYIGGMYLLMHYGILGDNGCDTTANNTLC